MAERAGRPPNRRKFDDATLVAARDALDGAAKRLSLPRGRYPDAVTGQIRTQARPLEAAVLAITLSEALEVVAAEQVELARTHDEVTWEQVGEAFDISMQSAHSRFRRRS